MQPRLLERPLLRQQPRHLLPGLLELPLLLQLLEHLLPKFQICPHRRSQKLELSWANEWMLCTQLPA